jgi:hypothetical protein
VPRRDGRRDAEGGRPRRHGGTPILNGTFSAESDAHRCAPVASGHLGPRSGREACRFTPRYRRFASPGASRPSTTSPARASALARRSACGRFSGRPRQRARGSCTSPATGSDDGGERDVHRNLCHAPGCHQPLDADRVGLDAESLSLPWASSEVVTGCLQEFGKMRAERTASSIQRILKVE